MQLNPKLVIGIGNPEPQYQLTYHNAGILFMLHLLGGADFKKLSAAAAQAKNENFSILKKNFPSLAISSVFMNASGKAVRAAAKKLKVKTEELLVVHDDHDIKIGDFKISFGRNSAGHRGVESVIRSLGTKNFWRLRIGIQKAGPCPKAGDLVLKKISPSDLKKLIQAFKAAAKTLKIN